MKSVFKMAIKNAFTSIKADFSSSREYLEKSLKILQTSCKVIFVGAQIYERHTLWTQEVY